MMETARRPRVLMLTSTLPRWEGDSEPRFVLDLAKNLSEHFDIELIAPHTRGAARSELLEGVRVTRFRYWIPRWQSVAYEGGISWRLRENPFRLFQVPLFTLSLAFCLLQRIWRGPGIDVVHAHWILPQGIVAVMVSRLLGRRIPVVCTSHGGDLFGLRGKVWTAIKRWVLRRTDAVTVVSTAMVERMKAISDGIEPLVIPMGTDLKTRFTPPEQPRKPPFKRLIFVGRLVEKKGVTHLIDAMVYVVRSYPDVTLDIIGHGPLRSELETKAVSLRLEHSICFRGPVPHSELPKMYGNADIAIFPFIEAASGDQEGLGLVTVEAMGCGCPVIVSDVPAVRDVVASPEFGVLVQPANSLALAEAICASIADPTASLQRAKTAISFVRDRFDWSASSSNFGHLYIKLIQRC